MFSARGYDEKFELNFDTIQRMYSFKQSLNFSHVISEILMYNFTENSICLNELNAIAHGLTNLDEWAIQSKFVRPQGHLTVFVGVRKKIYESGQT